MEPWQLLVAAVVIFGMGFYFGLLIAGLCATAVDIEENR